MKDGVDEVPVPLAEQDLVSYVPAEFSSASYQGEILELDIPHPVYDLDRGVWVRVERKDDRSSTIIEIIKREWIRGVHCPRCQNFLVGIRGTLTPFMGPQQVRLYKQCTHCEYFKEVR